MLKNLFEAIVSANSKLLKAGFLLTIGTGVPGTPGAFAQCNALVWADEFNGTSLNTANWSYTLGNGCGGSSGCGFGNGEREYYTTNNVTVSGGNLVITAKYEPNYNNSGSNYTSGKIGTNGKFSWKYGHMEASVKVPSATAIWPAYWMLADNGNWPRTGEIDILETQNANPVNANQTLHFFCTPCNNAQNVGIAVSNTNWSNAFHIFAIDWSPQKIVYSVDGTITKTYTPASIGVTGATTTDWPFDAQNFYQILNLAVGGSYTGNAVPNPADYPQSMLVDYVRVYTNSSFYVVQGDEISFVGDTKTYTVSDAGTGAVYNWTPPAGATIVSGQGSRSLTVKFTGVASGNLVATIAPSGCTGTDVLFAVKAINTTCALIIDDYESNRNIFRMSANGSYTAPVANPGTGGSNASAYCASYTRNSSNQYDILGFNKFVVGNPDDFRVGIRQFTMDVRSSVPAGTPITVEFDNTALLSKAYPSGRHSQYTAKTGAPNTWTHLIFTFSSSPDASLTGASVDKIQVLFNPNSYTNDVYYLDNFTAQGQTPATGAITGPSTACPNQQAVKYAVTGSLNSTYQWTIPAGASIASGQGTNNILVNFGNTSGTVGVTETNTALCSGAMVTSAVAVGGACVLNVNFSGTPLATCPGNSIAFTDVTTGKAGGETYAWDFGANASPSTSTNINPGGITYSVGGLKTVSLTVTNSAGPVTIVKSSYINISAAPGNCLFADDYTGPAVTWVNPTNSAFTHTQNNSIWSITGAGNPEWESFTYTLNNGTAAAPLNFACAANAPVLQITAKATSNALLRVAMVDPGGKSSDNWPGIDLELTTTPKVFTINFAGHFQNFNGATPGIMDSAAIGKLLFFINPGFASFPVTGKNQVYNTSFTGTVKVDWIGIGNNCPAPVIAGELNYIDKDSHSSLPNPFKEETVLRFNTLQSEKLNIKLMDMKGLVLLVKEGATNENISIGKDLAAGAYIVQAGYNSILKTLRIVKLE